MGVFDSMAGKSVFKDQSKLAFDYVPKSLPHRDEQLKRLFTLFRPVVDSNMSQTAFLTGSVGTGKTAMAKYFSKEFQKYASTKGKKLEFVVVNCRQRSTEDSALLKVLNHFQPNFPDRGFSIPEKLESLRKSLKKEGCHLIVILDEADVLLKKKTDLVYNFTRFDEDHMQGEHALSLMLISTRSVFDLMDSASASTFRRTNTVEFSNYGKRELYDILNNRLPLAFKPAAVRDDSVELMADISSEFGDARFAIEMLWKSGLIADMKGSGEVVPEHVRGAKAEIYSVVTESKLNELDSQKKLALLAVARTLKDEAYVTTGDVEKNYAVACEEYDLPTRGHTQFWKYLKELDALGLISAKAKSGKGGTTTLLSLPDIPSKELVTKLSELLEAKR